jgi:transcriptional regulator with XRE-family HTH domain
MNRIKEFRLIKGIRQIDLASYLNVSQSTLSNWERNVHDPDSESLIRLSNILDTSVDMILGVPELNTDTNKKEPTPKEELLLMIDRVPNDKFDKFKSLLLAAIDAVT